MTDPIKENLWTHCLFKCMKIAKANGQPDVKFEDVDKMVIEESFTIIEWRKKEEAP